MALYASLLGAKEAEVAWEVASCGSILIYGAAHATVHTRGEQKRHMGHLAHCKRFQACPVCTPYLMGRRLDALEPIALELAEDKTLRHFMVVLTIRHRRGAAWKDLVKVLRQMQAAVRRGHPWRNVVVGFIRLLESTYREKNGHHPHEHIIVSVRGGKGFNPEEFFTWVSDVCERTAAKSDRTCAFTGRWWSEISPKRLRIATKYLGRADKLGTADVQDDASNPLLELSTSTKHQPLWCIPPREFAKVWRASKRVKWFGTGGVWHRKSTSKTDEELDAEREEIGEVIAHIPRSVWTAWTSEQRREVRCLVADRDLKDADVVAYIADQGGVAGPPPLPDWGDPIA
jgi:hypothetical protein